MEFDTGISLVHSGSVEVESEKDFETMINGVWDFLSSQSKNVGEGVGAEFWVDFSTAIQTRTVVCNVVELDAEDLHDFEQSPAGSGSTHTANLTKQILHRYRISLRTGKRPGRMGDSLMGISAIGAFWFLSKSLGANPQPSHLVALGICVAALLVFLFFANLPFGKEKASELLRGLSTLS